MLALGPTLGPILWQLPRTLAFDPALIADFCALLPRTTADAATLAAHHDDRLPAEPWTAVDENRTLRHALEARHPSYADPRFPDLLADAGIASVVSDGGSAWPAFDVVTSDLVYVRLHGADELYASGYDDAAIDHWAARVRRWAELADVVVYFDNDAKVRAPRDAQALLTRLGLRPAGASAEAPTAAGSG